MNTKLKRTSELTDADYWDKHWQHRPEAKIIPPRHGHYGRNGMLLRTVRRRVNDLTNKRIAELGGGSSYRLLALTKWTGATAAAVDYSQEGLTQIESIFAANDCEVESVFADILAWDSKDVSFDLVVHWGLLEHFTDPVPVLKKSAELLAPGGKLVFSMPNMEAWGAYFWRRFSPNNWSTHIFHTDEFVASSCAAAGLKLAKTFYFGYPLLHIAPWENPGTSGKICSNVLSKILIATVAFDSVVPIFHRGVRQISSERGFLAHRSE